MNLNNIKIGHSPLTDEIFIYRHGKDNRVALDKRPAEHDVMAAIVSHMMHDAPKGSVKTFTLDNKKYKLTLSPVK